jgi:hypothetical protein
MHHSRIEIIGDIHHLLLMVRDIKMNTKLLIHPVHTMVSGGIILLANIITDPLFIRSRILKVLLQLE